MRDLINVEEEVGRTVGRRTTPRVSLALRPGAQADAAAWQRAFGGGLPRGVYRFHSHEEADEWLLRMLARPRKR